jgi:uncharacterized membrane protein YedE/YeeE
MEHFTPVSAAIGGATIGLSATMLWLGIGRIAGISGILGGLMTAGRGDAGWRWMFLAGLLAGPMLVFALTGQPAVTVAAGPGGLIAAGLLVGFGTRLGGGCTSGHGVCGIARLSPRSIGATALFMTSAAATVFFTHHLAGG